MDQVTLEHHLTIKGEILATKKSKNTWNNNADMKIAEQGGKDKQ